LSYMCFFSLKKLFEHTRQMLHSYSKHIMILCWNFQPHVIFTLLHEHGLSSLQTVSNMKWIVTDCHSLYYPTSALNYINMCVYAAAYVHITGQNMLP
jgi:hypothetical protein